MNDLTHKTDTFERAATADLPLDGAKARPTAMRRRRRRLLILLAATVLKGGLIAGGYWTLHAAHRVSTDNAYVGASTAQVHAQVSGPVAEVRADETDLVRKGDVLVVIDQADARLTLAHAEADYQHTLQRVARYFAQASAAEAQVQAREAELERAREEYERRRKLAANGTISHETLTAARTAAEAALANLNAANETLAAEAALTRGYTAETHPETVSARVALDKARLDLDRTLVRAPIDGVVAQRKTQVGQSVAPGEPLMSVTPIQDAYVDANFKEGQLAHVRVGQPVSLVSDLYGESAVYHGRVAGLGGGTGSAFAVIPAQNATGNWIKVVQRVPVRIALDREELAARPLRVGLSMKATIDTREAAN